MREDKRAIAAWSLYDWANSAFTTLVVTFVYSTYFTQVIAPDPVTGTTLWSRAIAISGLLIAGLSPVLGAIADASGGRRRYLLACTLVCVGATAALTFVRPDQAQSVLLALTIFVVANVAFEMGAVFYNALLPAIASPERIGRVSGYGWGLGYVGGLLCLAVALAVMVRDAPLFGIMTAEGFNVRATNLLVAAWFLAFSIPLFVFVRESQRVRKPAAIRSGLRNLRQTFHHVRRYREAAKFLLARMIYNDGLVTIFAFGGIYAAGTFGMSLPEVIQFGIVLNVAAGLGAWLFGFVDDRLGGRKTVLITLVALTAMTVLAAAAPSRPWFWLAGIGIGVFVGPNQSASRSLMARFVPARHQNEFFGFFAFSGKITAFLGPALLGAATGWFDSQRVGVATVLAFFVLGAALLLSVDERRGIEAARGAQGASPGGG